MKIFKNKHNLQKKIYNIKNMSFVPTMGGLHKGHISLIKRSKKFKGPCLVSIFVNPKQFNKKKDYISYPRNIKKDLKILKDLNVEYVYIPTFKDVYSFRTKNKVYLDSFSKKLCGKFRKGHFEGVLNIVNRLLEIVKPKYIFLGIKDFQQLFLIDQHIKKRKIRTKVIQCKTMRENNGVACSTRNQNINRDQLGIASNVYRYLKKQKLSINNKFKSFDYKTLLINLKNFGLKKIDYIELYDLNNIKKVKKKNKKLKIFIAYYLNKTRLIDNI